MERSFSDLVFYNYIWRVQVWDETDAPSRWSRAKFRLVPQRFSSAEWLGAITVKTHACEGPKFQGELKKPEVKAAWENVDTLARESICLRKTFHCTDKRLRGYRIHLCLMDSMEFTLDGKKVGDSGAPFWSNDYDKSVYYNMYDVTELLQEGENVAGVLLRNGFYNVQGGRYCTANWSTSGAPTLFILTACQL